MHTFMQKKNHYGKPLLCLLILLTWCCLMTTEAVGANEAAEDYVTTIVVLPSDPPSKVEWCFKSKIQECAMMVGGYYAVIIGNEFLVYPEPYDIFILIDILDGLYTLPEISELDEIRALFETEISLISGPPLLVTISEFEASVEAGITLIIGREVISKQPTSPDVGDEVGPPEDTTPEAAPEPTPPDAVEQEIPPEAFEPFESTEEEPTESVILPSI